jgi:membrane-associated phospholipid phosphatase
MDRNIFRWFNRLADHTGWAHAFFTAYAKFGIVLFAVLLVAAYLDGRQHSDARAVAGSVWAAAAALLALGIGQLIGGAIDRARPYEVISGVHVLIARTTDFSFPSDHATAVGAVAAGLWITNHRWGVIASALAVLMAFTRVYVGTHYVSDVIAGLALGAAVAIAGQGVVVPFLSRVALRTSSGRLRSLVVATAAPAVDPSESPRQRPVSPNRNS